MAYYTDEQIKRNLARQKMLKIRRRRKVIIIVALILAIVDGVFCGKALGNKRYEKEVETYSVVTDAPIVQTALTQLGNEKGKKFWSWYSYPSYVPWCACFVSWCENENGMLKSETAPKFAGCEDGIAWFKNHGRWMKAGETPKGGDIIFFDWDQDKAVDHVGIVSGVVEDKVFTVEGNSSDMCRQKRYYINSNVILGYGQLETT